MTNASKKECGKCGGNGLPSYKRDNGKCYNCGALPAGVEAPAAFVAGPEDREMLIREIRVTLNNVAEHGLWLLSDTDSYDDTTVETYLLRKATRAGPDVHARAVAAIARLRAGVYKAA